MKHTIFYSWQSDLPNNTNRGFIQNALEEAAAAVAADLNVEPVIQRDTTNVPGSPNITQAIFKKIAACDIFVADITLINPASAERRTPNPNVMLELGYAMRGLTDERIILVMNEHYGNVEELPFDLRMRRTVIYNISPDAAEKAPERHKLASILTTAITDAIKTIPPPTQPTDPVDNAIASVEAVSANRTLQVRNAMTDIVNKLELVAPRLFRNGATPEDLLQALEQTIPTLRKFTLLASAIASMNDPDAARVLYKGFTHIFQHYNNPRGFAGPSDKRDFDYWKFIGHELLTTLIAALLREERYDTIKTILDETITVNNQRTGTTPVTYDYASEYLHSLEPVSRARGRITVHADLLRDRHAHHGSYGATMDGPLSDVMPFDQFLAADYFLWLRGELSPADESTYFFTWSPASTIFLDATPAFLHNATRTTTADQLSKALDIGNVATLKDRLTKRGPRLSRMWERAHWGSPIQQPDIDRIGTR